MKLLVICDCLPPPCDPAAGWCGALAIVLPVRAVAALSLAAALDLEAREHTFKELLDFLQVQTRHLKAAASRREFAQLLLETESRLLGETVNWFSRRSFTGGRERGMGRVVPPRGDVRWINRQAGLRTAGPRLSVGPALGPG